MHQVQIGVDKVLLQVDVFIVPLLFIGKFVARMALVHDFLDSIDPHTGSKSTLRGCKVHAAVA